MQPGMNVTHHAMKVDAHLLLAIERIEKKVHEERLAPTDTSPQIHAPGSRLGCASWQVPPQPIEEGLTLDDGMLQSIEAIDHTLLCRVRDEIFRLKRSRVSLPDCHTVFFISGAA